MYVNIMAVHQSQINTHSYYRIYLYKYVCPYTTWFLTYCTTTWRSCTCHPPHLNKITHQVSGLRQIDSWIFETKDQENTFIDQKPNILTTINIITSNRDTIQTDKNTIFPRRVYKTYHPLRNKVSLLVCQATWCQGLNLLATRLAKSINKVIKICK